MHQQQQWHQTRLLGNLTGIPRWEQEFKQLDQTKAAAEEATHNQIEKNYA